MLLSAMTKSPAMKRYRKSWSLQERYRYKAGDKDNNES